jgi:hypothetical protein
MGGRTIVFALPLVGALVAACSDHATNDAPTAPSLATAPASPTCDFNVVKKDVAAAWPNNAGAITKEVNSDVSALLTTMSQNRSDSTIATGTGLQILDTLAHSAARKDPGFTPAAGSKLILDLLLCMDVGPATAIPASFVSALGDSGAFGVRGRSETDADPLVSHDGAWAVRPVGGTPWAQLENGGPTRPALSAAVRQNFLVFGRPGNANGFTADVQLNLPPYPSTVFEWGTVPTLTFVMPATTSAPAGPGIEIDQCDIGAAGAPYQPGFFQHNGVASSNQEILTSFAVSCPTSPTARARLQPTASLAEQLWKLVTPEPAYAAFFFGGGSGTRGTALSPWGVVNPGNVNLVFNQVVDKANNQVGVPLFDTQHQLLTLRVFSNAQSGGTFVTPFKQSAIFTWIEATNNQGVNVVACKNWAYTDANGVATFTNAFLNKSGGYTLRFRTAGTQVSTSAGDTPLAVAPGTQPFSELLNVKNGTFDPAGCTGNNVYTGNGQPPFPVPAPGQLSP